MNIYQTSHHNLKTAEHVSGFYIFLVFFLSTIGLLISGYLGYVHVMTHLDPLFSSACVIAQRLDCETVAQSHHAVFLGVPWAHWGILYYTCCLIIFSHLYVTGHGSLIPVIMLPLGSVHVAFSLYLTYLSLTKIGVFCPLCLIDHVIGLMFFTNGMAELIRIKFSRWRMNVGELLSILKRRRTCHLPLLCVTIVFIFIELLVPSYWRIPFTAFNLENIQTGVTPDGHPWIGARDPLITIEEYTDYRCFHCRKMHYQLRALIEQHPGTIRLVHRHYPLDHAYNPFIVNDQSQQGSGKLALAAIAAAEMGKFWPMNDRLYQLTAENERVVDLKSLAESIEVPAEDYAAIYLSDVVREKLRLDIMSGIENEILATPTYIINGKTYTGMLPMDEIRKILAVEQPP
jgi:uncharacterized membrane protein/protein-disulfide isomerase